MNITEVRSRLRKCRGHIAILIIATVTLGCGGGGSGDPVDVAGGQVGGGGQGTGQNTVPQITGTPATTVMQGSSYAFTPAATDADFDTLTFSIINKPAWLNFAPNSGNLSGTPGPNDTGTFSGIRITVTDGIDTASLAPFAITVNSSGSGGSTVQVTNTQPGNYEWGILAEGELVYVDRNYIFTDVPAKFVGLDFLQTANDDKFASGNGSVSFDVNTAVTVYVGYSVRNSTLPTWLQGWSKEADQIDTEAPLYDIYSREFGPGSVSLGGNEMGNSMYSVIVASSNGGGNNGGGNTNSAPTISGSPMTNVTAGNPYFFLPSANDADGDILTFTATNIPGWLAFNDTNGALTGVPGENDVRTYNNLTITVSDGMASATLPAFGIVVSSNGNGGGNTNSPPTISGTPDNSVTENVAYSFTPTANDSDGDNLSFTITSKPSWANFNTSTGRLSGTPDAGDIDTYNNIRIEVSDGQASAALPAFSISVLDDNNANGTASLSWLPPVTNEDGSNLDDLAGYRVYYGMTLEANCRNYPNVDIISNGGVSSATVTGLVSGTWHFSLTAYDNAGNESACSDNASKTIQ